MRNPISGLIRNSLLIGLGTLVFFLLGVFLAQPILISPSHPFVDDNGNGIDDFDESSGQYTDPDVRAQVYGINFPVPELGNCTDYASCRTFCEDPLNADTCVAYARSRGFYQDQPDDTKVQEILALARRQLGCDTVGACLQYCEIPTNYDKCHSFAQSQGLGGGYVHNPEDDRVLDRAKQVLGCDSTSTCADFCQKPENAGKCSDFARDTGLRGGEHRVGPGGCTSESTCRTFCSDPANYQICSGFAGSSGRTFTGPGGCNSPESCRAYCEQNRRDCGYADGKQIGAPPGGYNPQEMCNRTPNCAWSGNTCQCGFYGETRESAQRAGEYASFCSANPDKCKPGAASGFESSEQRAEFEKFCRENPDKCRPPETGTYTPPPGASPYPGGYYGPYYGGYYGGTDPATECSRYGCSWTGSSCNCAGTGYTPPSSYTTGCEAPASGCGSGTWDRGTCTCKPASGCPAGTSWNGSYCMQDSSSGGGSSTGCSPPSGGCGSGWFDNSSCSCKPASAEGCYNVSASSCGSGFYWDSAACTCRSTTSGGSAGSSCGTGYYWTGSYCAPSSYSGSGTGTYTPPPDSGTYTQPSSGESGGGYTAPSGDSGSYTPPPSEPAPQPVQGVATVRSFFQFILDFFGETFGR